MNRFKPICLFLLLLLGCAPSEVEQTAVDVTRPTQTATVELAVATATPQPALTPQPAEPTATRDPSKLILDWQTRLTCDPLCTDFALSENGEWLTFKGADRQIVHLATGQYKQPPPEISETTQLVNWLNQNDPHTLPTIKASESIIDFHQLEQCLPLEDEEASPRWEPCQNFKLSPDGQWLFFSSGVALCFQQRQLFNLQTGEQKNLSEGATGPEKIRFFLPDNSIIFQTSGGCHPNVGLAHYYPETEQTIPLPSRGYIAWNEEKTAFYVLNRHIEERLQRQYIWGYYPAQNFVFLSETPSEHYPIWLDEQHLIYQEQPINGEVPEPVTIESASIKVLDITTGEIIRTLADPAYDFHPCDWARVSGEEQNSCFVSNTRCTPAHNVEDSCFTPNKWVIDSGGWLRVERIPTQAGIYETTYENIPEIHLAITCARFYPAKCNIPVEPFLFNWQTGELKPVESPNN